MTDAQRIQNLTVPCGVIDAVLDTDAFNEVDDQFAISLFLRLPERIRPLALYAAPFYNSNSSGPADGMEKSYEELGRLLPLLGRTDVPVYRGSLGYLPSETEALDSPAARDLVARAKGYSPARPLYVVAIGAITNVASAILIDPVAMKENTVIVWLGGTAHSYPDTLEFNMRQDVAAARVLFSCGAPIVQLPCQGVVSEFVTSGPELRHWLIGKNPLADYLAQNVIDNFEVEGTAWRKVIWDVTAVAWLLNDNSRFMKSYVTKAPLPEYNNTYSFPTTAPEIRYVYRIRCADLFTDLFKTICGVSPLHPTSF
jgi:inosine-uridine nucleoside N-ribohydrolase